MQPHATDQAGVVGGGARRRRPLLASLTTLGVVTGLLGVAGVFAAGSDSATTGSNDAISGDIDGGGEPAVDLQLATASHVVDEEGFLSVTCNEDWSDDLSTGVITSDGEELRNQEFSGGAAYDAGFLCIRNVGDVAADVGLSAFDVVDVELGCSPGEAELDTGCLEGQVGELSGQLEIDLYRSEGQFSCEYEGTEALSALADDGSLPVGNLAPQEETTLCLGAFWGQANPVGQSDQASWRFRFDGVIATDPPPPPPECSDDAFEPNDARSTAAPMSGTAQGVSCNGNPDWFAYQHPGGSLTALLDFDAPTVDLDLEVHDAAGVLLAHEDGTTTDETITLTNLPAGTYTLLVTEFLAPGVASAPYTLTVSSFAP